MRIFDRMGVCSEEEGVCGEGAGRELLATTAKTKKQRGWLSRRK